MAAQWTFTRHGEIRTADTVEERVKLVYDGWVEQPTPEPGSYDALRVPELKAEIETRNTARADEEKLPTDGLKADLVAALVSDDQDDEEVTPA